MKVQYISDNGKVFDNEKAAAAEDARIKKEKADKLKAQQEKTEARKKLDNLWKKVVEATAEYEKKYDCVYTFPIDTETSTKLEKFFDDAFASIFR